MKNITIYFPDGKTSYYEVGQKLIMVNEANEHTPSDIEVMKISSFLGRVILKFSNGEKLIFRGLPYSTSRK